VDGRAEAVDEQAVHEDLLSGLPPLLAERDEFRADQDLLLDEHPLQHHQAQQEPAHHQRRHRTTRPLPANRCARLPPKEVPAHRVAGRQPHPRQRSPGNGQPGRAQQQLLLQQQRGVRV
jgi:hypothetical protein